MCFAKRYQIAVIVILATVESLEVPVDGVYRVRHIECVVVALLVAEHLFAGKDERGALRGEDDGLCQTCHALTYGIICLRH